MKYKITSYDELRKIVTARVTTDAGDLETAPLIPVCIQGMVDQAELESKLYAGFLATLTPQQLGNFSIVLENFALTSVGQEIPMSIETLPEGLYVQGSNANAVDVSTTGTDSMTVV